MIEPAFDRAVLAVALAQPEAADQACRVALENGAEFRVWSSGVSIVDLIRSYEIRVQRLADEGIATLSSNTLIGRLEGVAVGAVRLGMVQSEEFNFVVFLDVDEPVVLACVGIAASAANPD